MCVMNPMKYYKLSFENLKDVLDAFKVDENETDIISAINEVLHTKEFRFENPSIIGEHRYINLMKKLKEQPDSNVILYVNYPNYQIDKVSKCKIEIKNGSYDSELRKFSNYYYILLLKEMLPIVVSMGSNDLNAFLAYFDDINKLEPYVDYMLANNANVTIHESDNDADIMEFNFEHMGDDDGVDQFFAYSTSDPGYSFSVNMIGLKKIKNRVYALYNDD